MRRMAVLFVLIAGGSTMLTAGCEREPEKSSLPEELSLQALANFEYKEKMKLPEDVQRRHGKRVRVTGFMNPTTQARDLTTFLLVKDRGSCCFGKRPQINHYVEVTLRKGTKTHHTTDPVTLQGILKVEDRWDGDWQLGLYWMEEAEVAK